MATIPVEPGGEGPVEPDFAPGGTPFTTAPFTNFTMKIYDTNNSLVFSGFIVINSSPVTPATGGVGYQLLNVYDESQIMNNYYVDIIVRNANSIYNNNDNILNYNISLNPPYFFHGGVALNAVGNSYFSLLSPSIKYIELNQVYFYASYSNQYYIYTFNVSNSLLGAFSNYKVDITPIDTIPPPSIPNLLCFREGSRIASLQHGKECQVPVETLKKGDLVKTLCHGYKPIQKIGYRMLDNSGNDERIKNRLYHLSPMHYPSLTESLYITGCHAILVNFMTETQKQKSIELFDDTFITDNKHRLFACIDEKSIPYNKEETCKIYHFALESDNTLTNYGIFANGLLVESCSIRNMAISGYTDIV